MDMLWTLEFCLMKRLFLHSLKSVKSSVRYAGAFPIEQLYNTQGERDTVEGRTFLFLRKRCSSLSILNKIKTTTILSTHKIIKAMWNFYDKASL